MMGCKMDVRESEARITNEAIPKAIPKAIRDLRFVIQFVIWEGCEC